MTRAMKVLAALLITIGFIWLAVGFVWWNWNPGEWSEGTRFYSVLIFSLLAIPAVGIAAEFT